MTSANVIEYTIKDKSGKSVGRHRKHLLCKTNIESLLKFIPAHDYVICAWGYDEEEEFWENEPVKLDVWLKNNSGYKQNK